MQKISNIRRSELERSIKLLELHDPDNTLAARVLLSKELMQCMLDEFTNEPEPAVYENGMVLKVRWIKWYRKTYGVGLKEAVDYGSKHKWPEDVT